MKNLKSFVLPVIGLLLMLSPVLSGFTALMRVHPFAVVIIALVVALAFAVIPKKSRNIYTHVAGGTCKNFAGEIIIIQRYYKDNQFLQASRSPMMRYVLAGSVVHIPQKGAKPTVVKNRAEYPAVAVQRGG